MACPRISLTAFLCLLLLIRHCRRVSLTSSSSSPPAAPAADGFLDDNAFLLMDDLRFPPYVTVARLRRGRKKLAGNPGDPLDAFRLLAATDDFGSALAFASMTLLLPLQAN